MKNDSVTPSAGFSPLNLTALATDQLSLVEVTFALQSGNVIAARQACRDTNSLKNPVYDGLRKALQEGDIEQAKQALAALEEPETSAPRPFGSVGHRVDIKA